MNNLHVLGPIFCLSVCPSVGRPGWPQTHYIPEDDLELLVLLYIKNLSFLSLNLSFRVLAKSLLTSETYDFTLCPLFIFVLRQGLFMHPTLALNSPASASGVLRSQACIAICGFPLVFIIFPGLFFSL